VPIVTRKMVRWANGRLAAVGAVSSGRLVGASAWIGDTLGHIAQTRRNSGDPSGARPLPATPPPPSGSQGPGLAGAPEQLIQLQGAAPHGCVAEARRGRRSCRGGHEGGGGRWGGGVARRVEAWAARRTRLGGGWRGRGQGLSYRPTAGRGSSRRRLKKATGWGKAAAPHSTTD